jgi:hypothetical protein
MVQARSARLLLCAVIGLVLFPIKAGIVRASDHPLRVRITSTAKPVYQTNFRKGTLGWSSSGTGGGTVQWRAAGGFLSFSANPDGGYPYSALIAPYDPRKLKGYAIEASMQSNPDNNYGPDPSFGIVARITPHSDMRGNGIFGAVHYQLEDWEYPSSAGIGYLVDWTGYSPEWTALNESDFDAGTAWHTYRLEVRGVNYRFLVDGTLAASGTSTAYASASRIGLFASNVQLTVRSFRVFALN